MSTKNISIIALMSAIICILAPISIPLGFTDIPISLGLFAILITAYVLTPTQAVISVLIYILLGSFGLPVFSKYTGGIGVLFGPTGGYIIGYLATVSISSYIIHKFPGNILYQAISLVIGVILCYLLGTIWFSMQKVMPFSKALILCVFPFIPADILKIIISIFIGNEINKRLVNIRK
jgi:hypothetical protein